MKRLLLLLTLFFAVSTLSAQGYKVGDIYDVDGKRGVVFEVSEDGVHGKIVAVAQPTEKMTWYKAMEFGKTLNNGWYIPSLEEMQTLLGASEAVGATLQKNGCKAPHFCWTTDEFNVDCAWVLSVRTDSYGGFYKANKFNVCIISKF